MVYQDEISVSTTGPGDLHDLTEAVRRIVGASRVRRGIVHLFNVGSTGALSTIELSRGCRKFAGVAEPAHSARPELRPRTRVA